MCNDDCLCLFLSFGDSFAKSFTLHAFSLRADTTPPVRDCISLIFSNIKLNTFREPFLWNSSIQASSPFEKNKLWSRVKKCPYNIYFCYRNGSRDTAIQETLVLVARVSPEWKFHCDLKGNLGY